MLLKDWDIFFFVELKVTAYDAKSNVTAYNTMRAEINMMERHSFWPFMNIFILFLLNEYFEN